MCARFFELYIIAIYWEGAYGAIFGCTVFEKVHPVSARNKSLISDTEYVRVLPRLRILIWLL